MVAVYSQGLLIALHSAKVFKHAERNQSTAIHWTEAYCRLLFTSFEVLCPNTQQKAQALTLLFRAHYRAPQK